MPAAKIRKKILASILLIAASVAVTILLDRLHFFARMELASFDHRVGVFRADKAVHADLLVVLIDDESLQRMAGELGRWPWPRSAYRDILDFFTLARVEAVDRKSVV